MCESLPNDIFGAIVSYCSPKSLYRIDLCSQSFLHGFCWDYVEMIDTWELLEPIHQGCYAKQFKCDPMDVSFLQHQYFKASIQRVTDRIRRHHQRLVELRHTESAVPKVGIKPFFIRDIATDMAPFVKRLTLISCPSNTFEKCLSQVQRQTLQSLSVKCQTELIPRLRDFIASGLPKLTTLKFVLSGDASAMASLLDVASTSIGSLSHFSFTSYDLSEENAKECLGDGYSRLSAIASANRTTLRTLDFNLSMNCQTLFSSLFPDFNWRKKDWDELERLCLQKFCVPLNGLWCCDVLVWQSVVSEALQVGDATLEEYSRLFEMCYGKGNSVSALKALKAVINLRKQNNFDNNASNYLLNAIRACVCGPFESVGLIKLGAEACAALIGLLKQQTASPWVLSTVANIESVFRELVRKDPNCLSEFSASSDVVSTFLSFIISTDLIISVSFVTRVVSHKRAGIISRPSIDGISSELLTKLMSYWGFPVVGNSFNLVKDALKRSQKGDMKSPDLFEALLDRYSAESTPEHVNEFITKLKPWCSAFGVFNDTDDDFDEDDEDGEDASYLPEYEWMFSIPSICSKLLILCQSALTRLFDDRTCYVLFRQDLLGALKNNWPASAPTAPFVLHLWMFALRRSKSQCDLEKRLKQIIACFPAVPIELRQFCDDNVPLTKTRMPISTLRQSVRMLIDANESC